MCSHALDPLRMNMYDIPQIYDVPGLYLVRRNFKWYEEGTVFSSASRRVCPAPRASHASRPFEVC